MVDLYGLFTKVFLTKKMSKRVRYNHVCVSGGAQGADTVWSRMASAKGMTVQIMTFRGHHSIVRIEGAEMVELGPKCLRSGDEALKIASTRMKRSISERFPVKQLLQRNWWIVKNCQALFVLGWLDSKLSGLGVDGGTGWACEMYYWLDQGPIFLFNMNTNKWMEMPQREKKEMEMGEWVEMDRAPYVYDYEIVGMIGSRKLTEEAIKQVDVVFDVITVSRPNV